MSAPFNLENSLIISAGLQGPPGPSGFTITTASYVQPASGVSVAVFVRQTGWMSIGQNVFVATGGAYTVQSIPSSIEAFLLNTGASGNAAPNSTINAGVQVGPQGSQGPQGNTGPQGPQGNQGNQGPAGSGTTIAAATAISSSGSVPSGRLVREDIDMSQASQITRTLAASPSNGDIYWAKLINGSGTSTTPLLPVLFIHGGAGPMEDPENMGQPFTFSAVKSAILGDSILWQYSTTYGWVIIGRGLSAQLSQ